VGAGGLWLDLARTLLALLAVCVLGWLSLRWLSRRGFGVAATGPDARLRIIQRLPLETRKNLYLVKAGHKLLLIGTGEAGPPRLIAELDETVLGSQETSDATGSPSA
jgi:flagellar protein FliO/FliZ